MTIVSNMMKECPYMKLYNQVQQVIGNRLDQAGRVFSSVTKDFANTKDLITHLKLVDAFSSIGKTFYGREPSSIEKHSRSTLGMLKGVNAMATLQEGVLEVVKKVHMFVSHHTFRVGAELASSASGLINKMHDCATFLGERVAIPYFKKLSETYKDTHMQALAVGSSIRGFFAGEKAVGFLQGKTTWKEGWESVCKIAESVGGLLLSIFVLNGSGSKQIAAASAFSAVSGSARYCVSKLL